MNYFAEYQTHDWQLSSLSIMSDDITQKYF